MRKLRKPKIIYSFPKDTELEISKTRIYSQVGQLLFSSAKLTHDRVATSHLSTLLPLMKILCLNDFFFFNDYHHYFPPELRKYKATQRTKNCFGTKYEWLIPLNPRQTLLISDDAYFSPFCL